MNITRTSNPTLGDNAFTKDVVADGTSMTMRGVVNKTLIFFALLLVSAAISWQMNIGAGLLIAAAIGALILGIVTSFSKKNAAITGSLYAICEGIVLGAISSMFNAAYSGIVLQAVALTLLVFGIMLFTYKTGMLKASAKFVKIIVIATAAIGIFYLVSFIASFFTNAISNFLFANPLLGIIISLVIVVVAALNLILDFSFIEQSVNSGAPKYMEWYAGFGLMVTLVWLYIEILRLLSYLRRD